MNINNFNKITINHNNSTFIIEPKQLFYVYSNEKLFKIVVMFNISMITDDNIISCNIPYYMSDGHTNYFRANMLYPFNLFNNIKNPWTHSYVENMLIKTSLVKNINMELFNEYILNETRKNLIELEKTSEEADELITKIKNSEMRLISILSRINNLLDFLIAINVELIINDEIIDNNIFRPNYIEGIERYIGINEIAKYSNRKDIGIEDDLFRKHLYLFLNSYAKKFIEASLYTLEKIILEPQDISIIDFNNMLNFCNPIRRQISPETQEKYDKYVILSRFIYDIFTQKLVGQDIGKFNRTLFESEIITLDNNLLLFHASCREEFKCDSDDETYGGYKKKYLKLKNINKQIGGYDNLLIHISGPQGAGKTTLGSKLKKKYNDKIYFKDMDDIYYKFNNQDKIKDYQQFINYIIKKYNDKPLIIAGLTAERCQEDMNDEDETFFTIDTQYKYLIDIGETDILRQRFLRQVSRLYERKDIYFNSWLKDNEKMQKKFFRFVNLNKWKSNNFACNDIHIKHGYKLTKRNDIFNQISELIDNYL